MWDKPLLWRITARHLTSGALVFSAVAFGLPAAYDARAYLKSDARIKITENSRAISEHKEMLAQGSRLNEMLEHMIGQRERSSNIACRYESPSWLACTAHRVYLRFFPPSPSP